jgi:histone-lysine N-methyltransferase SETMAR
MENQKLEYRSVIKFLVLEGESPSNIYQRMVVVYGEHAPSRTTVFEWARRFKDGQLNIEDDPRCGRPITATDDQTVGAVESLIIENRRITIQEIADALGISTYTVHGIIHDKLHMTKVSSRWAPHLLIPDQRHERVQSCLELLARYSAEGDDFLFRIITGDESFLYYYQPESKQSSKEWKRADSPPPTKLKQAKSVGKVLYSFFWDHKGIILKEPTPAGVTITKEYYANILVELHQEIKKQRRGLVSAGVILHHDNAPAHTSFLVSSTIHNLKYELLRHPPYSPDLAPSDYFLFPVLKDYLAGRHYNDRSSLGSSIYQCLNSMSEDDYTAAIRKLPERWQKCISAEGRYFEKQHIH